MMGPGFGAAVSGSLVAVVLVAIVAMTVISATVGVVVGRAMAVCP